MEKVYVDVILQQHADGSKLPMTIVWEDGRHFDIDRVIRVTNACSTKVGGCGVRYDIIVNGKLTFLFEENGKFFVEAKRA